MRVDAVAFDAFGTLFDLESLRAPAGNEVFDGFVARLVPWTWHATSTGRYRPFPEIAADALRAAGATDEQALAGRLSSLPPFEDVGPGLERLGGIPLAILSNGTAEGVAALVENARLTGRFEYLLTAQVVEKFKPAPEVYAQFPAAFGVPAERALLVSSNEWDVAGAGQFGLRTAWVARGRNPAWVLGVEADVVVEDLGALAGAIDSGH